MTDDEYSEHEDIQGMIDRAVERDGPEYVAENIDQLLAGLGVVNERTAQRGTGYT